MGCASSSNTNGSDDYVENASSSSVRSLMEAPVKQIHFPLSNAHDRITKKPFGIFITPETSPVSPERFHGYHAGTDFEILPDEEDADVVVSAMCDGPVIVSRMVNGYGGVLIQKCTLEEVGLVTVLYGHLALNSMKHEIGTNLTAGQSIGVLGVGFTAETDGERKHLHLSVHRGEAIEYRGYVQSEAELQAWIDPMTLLRSY